MHKTILTIISSCALGFLAWTLPPHLIGDMRQHYPETNWIWLGDAYNNIKIYISIPCIFFIGVFYGLVNPRHIIFSFFTTFWVAPLNVALDVSIYPTSHNLFPIELIFFGLLNIPTLLGAWIGKNINLKLISKTQPSQQKDA